MNRSHYFVTRHEQSSRICGAILAGVPIFRMSTPWGYKRPSFLYVWIMLRVAEVHSKKQTLGQGIFSI